MVESQTSKRPHYVNVFKNGKVTCKECPDWKAFKICAHALAVAEKEGATAKYLIWLCKKRPARMNVTAMVTFDSSCAAGKKGERASTIRRKVDRTATQQEVTKIIDRPFHDNGGNSSSNLPSTEIPPPHDQLLPSLLAYPGSSQTTSFQTIPPPVGSVRLPHVQSSVTNPPPVAFVGLSLNTTTPWTTNTKGRRIYFISFAVLSNYGTLLLWMLPAIKTKWYHCVYTI